MRVFNLVKTTTLASVFLILLLPYLICLFPSIMNLDHAGFGRGTSMTPNIQEGDLVAVRAVGLEGVEVGDVLAVRFGEKKIVHRLIEIVEGETTLLRLKGDGNDVPDQRLYDASQVMGKVVAVYPLRCLFTSYGYVISTTASVLLAVYLWRSPEIDLDIVLLCLIISISMVGVIGYNLRGGWK